VDFAFDADQDLLRDSTRRFLDKRHPLAALRPVLEAAEVVDRAVWRDGCELGWAAMLVPAEHGGGSVTDQPLVDAIVIAEELGRVLYPGPFVPTNVVADAVARAAADGLRKEVLPGIAAGETVAAWCLTGDGSTDLSAVEVAATEEGDQLRLDGVARYVHGATIADVLLVAATTATGVVHVLVPATEPGVAVRRLEGLDLTRRLAEVRFDGAVVPRSSVVADADAGTEGGTEGGGDALVARALDLATVLQSAEAVGAAEHLLDTTVQYAKDRVQFGRPIGSFQAIKHRLADLFVTVEAMRAATHDAALTLGDAAPDAPEAVAVAGSYVADAYAHVCGEVIQLHGGIGFTWEHDAHLFVRRAKVDQVLYGAPDWHRERLCRLVEGQVG
jgi:alkylation response protein AidB-like acyl-CoA dehydrogenase